MKAELVLLDLAGHTKHQLPICGHGQIALGGTQGVQRATDHIVGQLGQQTDQAFTVGTELGSL